MRKFRGALLTRPQEPVKPVAVETQKCRHYWIIESSPGCVSKGICKICGGKKEFVNCLSDSWSDINMAPPSKSHHNAEPDAKEPEEEEG